MNHSDFDLAVMLLDYLRKWDRGDAQSRFNVIGKGDSPGLLELNLGIRLAREERQTLLWLWSEFERNRLHSLAHEDGWATLSERGKTISPAELRQMVTHGEISPLPLEKQTDPVLGIPNRGEYDRRLSELAREASTTHPLSLIVFDIDHFKKFNDEFGHRVGDLVLKYTADSVSQTITGKGECFRYGGEEIVVLLPNHSAAEGASVAERIRWSVESVEVPAIERGVTASLGISTLPEIASSAEELFQQADRAMYQSKEKGRNQVTVATGGKVSTSQKAPARDTKPNLRFRLLEGSRERYLLNVENASSSDVRIGEIGIEQNEIALMTPVRAQDGAEWIVAPGGTTSIEWIPDPNPAASLTHLHSNEGIQFTSNIDLVATLMFAGTQHEHRQRLAVKVFVTNASVKQLAG